MDHGPRTADSACASGTLSVLRGVCGICGTRGMHIIPYARQNPAPAIAPAKAGQHPTLQRDRPSAMMGSPNTPPSTFHNPQFTVPRPIFRDFVVGRPHSTTTMPRLPSAPSLHPSLFHGLRRARIPPRRRRRLSFPFPISQLSLPFPIPFPDTFPATFPTTLPTALPLPSSLSPPLPLPF